MSDNRFHAVRNEVADTWQIATASGPCMAASTLERAIAAGDRMRAVRANRFA